MLRKKLEVERLGIYYQKLGQLQADKGFRDDDYLFLIDLKGSISELLSSDESSYDIEL